jgi:hypothetical protein
MRQRPRLTVTRAIKGFVDQLHHSVEILRYVAVPETKHAIAFVFEPTRPLLIMRNALSGAVLRTVDFDDKSRAQFCA